MASTATRAVTEKEQAGISGSRLEVSIPALPFEAIPGTFTRHWLGTQPFSSTQPGDATRDLGIRVLVGELRQAYQQYIRPNYTPHRTLAEAVALSCAPLLSRSSCAPCFLTILPDHTRVLLVHGLSTYAASFGSNHSYQGRTMAFAGEKVDGHLFPSLLVAPTSLHSSSPSSLLPSGSCTGSDLGNIGEAKVLFGTHEYNVPSLEILKEYYDNALNDSSSLFPLTTAEDTGHERAPTTVVKATRLAYVPTRWAPHFLGGMHPYEALCVAEALVNRDIGVVQQFRAVAEPLLQWLRCACCSGKEHSTQSVVSVPWVQVLTSMDRTLHDWAVARMGQTLGDDENGLSEDASEIAGDRGMPLARQHILDDTMVSRSKISYSDGAVAAPAAAAAAAAVVEPPLASQSCSNPDQFASQTRQEDDPRICDDEPDVIVVKSEPSSSSSCVSSSSSSQCSSSSSSASSSASSSSSSNSTASSSSSSTSSIDKGRDEHKYQGLTASASIKIDDTDSDSEGNVSRRRGSKNVSSPPSSSKTVSLDYMVTEKIRIPSLVPRNLLQPNGKTHREMEQRTGCLVDLRALSQDDHEQGGDVDFAHYITITGASGDEVKDARMIIEDVILKAAGPSLERRLQFAFKRWEEPDRATVVAASSSAKCQSSGRKRPSPSCSSSSSKMSSSLGVCDKRKDSGAKRGVQGKSSVAFKRNKGGWTKEVSISDSIASLGRRKVTAIVVGKHRSNINEIQRATNCSVDIRLEDEVVRVSGDTKRNVDRAIDAVREKLEVTRKVSLVEAIAVMGADITYGRIIGKGKRHIQGIETVTGCALYLDRGEEVVHVTGNVSKVDKAVELIFEKLEAISRRVSLAEYIAKHGLDCTCGRLIGKNGSKAKFIRDTYGCAVEVRKSEKVAIVFGFDEKSVKCAVDFIKIYCSRP